MERTQIRFNGKVYSLWLDGADINRIRHEALPRDDAKFQAVRMGFLPALVISVLILIWWATAGGGSELASLAFISVAAAVAGGFIRKSSIERESRNALRSAAGLDTT